MRSGNLVNKMAQRTALWWIAIAILAIAALYFFFKPPTPDQYVTLTGKDKNGNVIYSVNIPIQQYLQSQSVAGIPQPDLSSLNWSANYTKR